MLTAPVCTTHPFTGEAMLIIHARAERCENFFKLSQRDAYADAHTRGMCLARIFNTFDSEDHRTVRWAMIAPLIKHIAGRRS